MCYRLIGILANNRETQVVNGEPIMHTWINVPSIKWMEGLSNYLEFEVMDKNIEFHSKITHGGKKWQSSHVFNMIIK